MISAASSPSKSSKVQSIERNISLCVETMRAALALLFLKSLSWWVTKFTSLLTKSMKIPPPTTDTFSNRVHEHDWSNLMTDVTGVWEKRDCPGGQVYFIGSVQKCHCSQLRFVPKNNWLRIVECEQN